MNKKAVSLQDHKLEDKTIMKRATLYCVFVLLCTGLLFAQSSYTFVSIDYPGAILTRAFDINDAGVIVGVFRLPGQANRGFMLRQGIFTELPAPDPDAGLRAARGINDRDDVVGLFTLNVDNSEHGFLLSTGTSLRLDFPGAAVTDAWGINNRGSIVGSFVDVSGVLHGWLRRGSTYTQIDIPGALDTVPFGINDRGQIVGGWDTAPNTVVGHGFLLAQGKATSYDVPSAVGIGNQLNRINDVGDIIGIFQDNNGALHGFVLQGGLSGPLVQLDYPGGTQTSPWGINNAGQIVGKYTDSNGVDHGFLAQPANVGKPQ
jgi:probable HAF family extracellular repeat protein